MARRFPESAYTETVFIEGVEHESYRCSRCNGDGTIIGKKVIRVPQATVDAWQREKKSHAWKRSLVSNLWPIAIFGSILLMLVFTTRFMQLYIEHPIVLLKSVTAFAMLICITIPELIRRSFVARHRKRLDTILSEIPLDQEQKRDLIEEMFGQYRLMPLKT